MYHDDDARKRWEARFQDMFADNVHRRISPSELRPCMRRTFATLTIGIEIELAELGVDLASRHLREFFAGCPYDYRLATCRVMDYHDREWKVTRDTTIGEGGFELVSPVIGYRDLPLVRELLRTYHAVGARPTDTSGFTFM